VKFSIKVFMTLYAFFAQYLCIAYIPVYVLALIGEEIGLISLDVGVSDVVPVLLDLEFNILRYLKELTNVTLSYLIGNLII